MTDELDREQVDALLARLSTDDAYRKLFVSDLAGALRELPGSPGVPQNAEPGSCLRPAVLADKQTLADAHQRIVEEWMSLNSLIPKILEP